MTVTHLGEEGGCEGLELRQRRALAREADPAVVGGRGLRGVGRRREVGGRGR